jgi:uncharacterized Zn-binding protein involved in type VI secretion
MPKLSRQNDQNAVGGKILRGSPTVLVDNVPAGLHVSKISPHSPYGPPHPPHEAASTITGSTTILIDNVPVLMVGSSTSCGHNIVTGSPSVEIT